MCLTKICKKNVVLKKDMVVKKVVGKNHDGSLFFGVIAKIYIDIKCKQKIQKGLNKADLQRKVVDDTYKNGKYRSYTSGFHCYLDKKSDKEIYKRWALNHYHTEKIVKFTIPAGTKVTVGIEDHHGSTVIVTPELIY